MARYAEKKEVKKALEQAKILEKEPEPIPTREKEVELVKDTVSLAEKLKSLLKPEWFVKDVHKACKKCDKAKKSRAADNCKAKAEHSGKEKEKVILLTKSL